MTGLSIIALMIIAIVAVLFLLVIGSTIAKKGRWGINPTAPNCPNCGNVIGSQVRVPKSMNQALWGGWTCTNCGTEVDKWGKSLTKP